jgi:predicted transcriptional regulator
MRRPAPPREIPPPLELECLKALWALGEGNVRDVVNQLAPSRRLAYTTVMTLLDRLVKKGGARRRKVGRRFLYTPVLSREALRRVAVRELAESLFDGSRDELLAYLEDRLPAQAPEEAPLRDGSLDTTLL